MTWFTMKDRIGFGWQVLSGSTRNAATLSSVSALTCGPKSLIRAMEKN